MSGETEPAEVRNESNMPGGNGAVAFLPLGAASLLLEPDWNMGGS